MDAVPAHVHVVALLAVDDVHAVAPVDVDVVLAVLDVDAVEAYVGRAVAFARRVGIAGAIGVVFASIRIGGGLTASVLFRILSASRAGTTTLDVRIQQVVERDVVQARQGDEVVRVGRGFRALPFGDGLP